MEAEEGCEVRSRVVREPFSAAGEASPGASLSGTSYWLDLWLFLLFDAVLFVFFYLLP